MGIDRKDYEVFLSEISNNIFFEEELKDFNVFQKYNAIIKELYDIYFIKDNDWWENFYSTVLNEPNKGFRELLANALFSCNSKVSSLPYYNNFTKETRYGDIVNSINEVTLSGYPYSITSSFFNKFFLNCKPISPELYVNVLKNFSLSFQDVSFLISSEKDNEDIKAYIKAELFKNRDIFSLNLSKSIAEGKTYSSTDKKMPFPDKTIKALYSQFNDDFGTLLVPFLHQKELDSIIKTLFDDESRMSFILSNRMMPETASAKSDAMMFCSDVTNAVMCDIGLADNIALSIVDEAFCKSEDTFKNMMARDKVLSSLVRFLSLNKISDDVSHKILLQMLDFANYNTSPSFMPSKFSNTFLSIMHKLCCKKDVSFSSDEYEKLLNFVYNSNDVVLLATLKDHRYKDDKNKSLYQEFENKMVERYVGSTASRKFSGVMIELAKDGLSESNIKKISSHCSELLFNGIAAGINNKNINTYKSSLNNIKFINEGKFSGVMEDIANIMNEYNEAIEGGHVPDFRETIATYLVEYCKNPPETTFTPKDTLHAFRVAKKEKTVCFNFNTADEPVVASGMATLMDNERVALINTLSKLLLNCKTKPVNSALANLINDITKKSKIIKEITTCPLFSCQKIAETYFADNTASYRKTHVLVLDCNISPELNNNRWTTRALSYFDEPTLNATKMFIQDIISHSCNLLERKIDEKTKFYRFADNYALISTFCNKERLLEEIEKQNSKPEKNENTL